ncbi:unnamed protein product [Symbiodinium sp. CCMP2592]|nr:unnamed protein product [Symbiodinium sp. CCMP2592]
MLLWSPHAYFSAVLRRRGVQGEPDAATPSSAHTEVLQDPSTALCCLQLQRRLLFLWRGWTTTDVASPSMVPRSFVLHHGTLRSLLLGGRLRYRLNQEEEFRASGCSVPSRLSTQAAS